jgi:hypothetical protein
MPGTLSLFGIFLLLGAVPIAIKSARRVSVYRQSRAWPKVQATITQSFVQEGSSGDGMAELPEFAFCYLVAGTEYTSSRHTEGIPLPGTDEDVRQMLARFPIGSAVQVAVNPANPGCAILDTGFPQAWTVARNASVIAIVLGIAITLVDVFG